MWPDDPLSAAPPIDLIPVVQSQSNDPPITLPEDLEAGYWLMRRSSDGTLRPYGEFVARAFVLTSEFMKTLQTHCVLALLNIWLSNRESC